MPRWGDSDFPQALAPMFNTTSKDIQHVWESRNRSPPLGNPHYWASVCTRAYHDVAILRFTPRAPRASPFLAFGHAYNVLPYGFPISKKGAKPS